MASSMVSSAVASPMANKAKDPDPKCSAKRLDSEGQSSTVLETLKAGESCFGVSDGLADLLFMSPDLYNAMRKSVGEKASPSVKLSHLTLVSDTSENGHQEEFTTVLRFQILYIAENNSDVRSSDEYVADVTVSSTSTGYEWTQDVKFQLTDCVQSPDLAVCTSDTDTVTDTTEN
jgi:hypothetical protein